MLHLYLFIYLVLAHLLADFVFQPEALVKWKHQSWKGIFVHALILFVTTLVFFWPFLIDVNIWGVLVLLFNAALHFLMDSDKIRMERRHKHYVKLFFLDQFFHVVVIAVLTFFLAYLLRLDPYALSQVLSFFSSFLPFALYLITAVLSTYVYEIVKFQFSRHKTANNATSFNYRRMFIRLMILSLIFGLALVLTGYRIAQTFFST